MANKAQKKPPLEGGWGISANYSTNLKRKFLPGIELFLQGATPQLSLPLQRFTSEFEMDRCGSTAP